jgi:predicted CxxxxCH...CXXCH cytochrome family protein
MPPVDAAYRNISTGGFMGSHQTHQPAAATPFTCSVCHPGSASYTTSHMDEAIELSSNINSSPLAATYSKGVFFNQTSRPVMGTCGNVNCHFEQTTPIWSAAPLVSPTGCGTCHAVPPSDGNHPASSGPGKKHGDYYGTTTTSCARCHPDHAGEAKPFAHATSAGHRGLVIGFSAPNSGGSYSGNVSYPGYLPSQNPARNGSCSGLYCHSDGNGGAPNTAPTWGSTLPADCSGCHGGNATAAKTIATGTHGSHINNAAVLGTNFDCARCHSSTVSLGSDRTITGLASHVDGSKTVAFSTSGTYTAATKTCAATACHSSGKSAAPQPAAPVWGGSPLGCNGCHGTSTTTGMPDYANGGAAAALANSHPKHVTSSADCDKCHTGTTANGVAIRSGSALHTNGAIDITFNSSKAGSAAVWTAASKSCSATYCHGAATPVWGGSLASDCTSCHGNDAVSASPISTGKHTAHTNNAAVLGTNNNFGCVDCHAKTVSNDRTIANAANHANGFVDYSGARAGGSSHYSTSTKLCTNFYCHSNGNLSAVVYVNPSAWNSTATLGCNGCHGTTTTTGAPDYANGGAGTTTANSHAKHVSGAGITDTRGCARCHSRTVDPTTAGKLRNYSTAHLSGKPDVAFAAAVGGGFNATTSTCSATYCHGSTASPTWGSPSLACNACHSANNALPGAHSIHYATTALAGKYLDYSGNVSAAGAYRFTCSSCHGGPAVHANGAANANGAAEVYFSYSGAGLRGSYSYGTTQGTDNGFKWTNGSCTATYCHSNGNGAPGNNTAFTWASPAGTLGCTGCHGGDAASGAPIAAGKHSAHTNNAAVLGTNFGCADCHAKTVSSNSAIANKANHVNRFKDYSGARAGGSAHYSTTTKSCTNFYCHSNGRGGYSNPPAWNSTATLGCNGCHGTTTSTGAPDYANGGAATASANNHAKHVSGSSDCDKCHTGTTTNGTAIKAGSTLHVNGAIDVGFDPARAGSGATWNGATMTCSATYCHGANSPVWGATLPTDCTGCHGGTSSSAAPMATNAHGTHITKAYGPGTYLGSTISSCQTCHIYNSVQPDPRHANGVVDLSTGAGSACTNCHPGTIPTWTVSTRLNCTACHGATPSTLPNGVAAPYKGNFATTGHGQFAASNQCTICHDPNSAHIAGSLGVNMRLILANDNTLCGSCHNGTTARQESTHVLDKNATPTPDLCKSCHDVHGTTNVHMIRTTINNVTISFTNTSTAFVQTAAPYQGLCQVCHTLTNHYKAGQALDGHPTRNCLNCHKHNAVYAFQPSTACDACHGYPPVPAGFVGTHGNYSSARMEDYTGGGGAHTIARHVKPTAMPAEGWANCTVCHGNGSLSPATHTMNLPVSPGKITIDPADRYKFNADLPLGSGQYNGILVDTGAHATGSCFNVKCHFKPSKKWSPLK